MRAVFCFLEVLRVGCEENICALRLPADRRWVRRVSLREDFGESRLVRVRVHERGGARINAMHVSVNPYPKNVRHEPFPDERRKNR